MQPAFPYPQGPAGVPSWAAARGGSAALFLTRAFTGRQSQFPKKPSPSMTLHLWLLAGHRVLCKLLGKFCKKPIPTAATSITVAAASLTKHL